MARPLLDIWIPAARPTTLAAALAPVLTGIGIAVHDDVFAAGHALVALLGAVCIQIGTNFANDYFDACKGADTPDRIGPTRATASGLVPPETMRRAFLLVFGAALLCGVYLTAVAGWPVVVIGLLAILFGILYTGGPAPLAYTGLADPFVLHFFGPVATGGTVFVQTGQFHATACLAGLAPGLIAVALLTVNNLRDIETDRPVGKNTLAVRFGATYAKAQYVVCLLGAALVPVLLWQLRGAPALQLLGSAACLAGVLPLRRVLGHRPGDPLSTALAGTGGVLVFQGLLACTGWALA